MAKKPKLFRIYDLYWLLLAIAFTVPIALIHTHGDRDPARWQSIGMIGIVVFAWTAWPTVIWWRWKFIRQIAYVTMHGLLVVPGSFPVSKSEVEEETERTLEAWRKTDIADPTVDGTYVVFKELPLTTRELRGELSGYAKPEEKSIWVGYREPISSSALAHELSHMILANAGRNWSDESLKAYRERFGVPY